jgi:creatinine amidohydrolase
MADFVDLTSPELAALAEQNALVLLPVGQVEEHGPHLPVGTDLFIARHVVRAAAAELEDRVPTVLLPSLWTGYSGAEMARWPGTFRVRTRVFLDLVYDVCLSLIESGFRKACLINAHGHHTALLEVAVREVADATDVYFATLEVARLARETFQRLRRSEPGGAIHGGEFETSLLLYLGHPVDMSLAHDEDHFRYSSPNVPGDGFSGGKPGFWSTWGIQRSTTGIYGSPTYASRETGEAVFRAMVDNAVSFLLEYHAHSREEQGPCPHSGRR